jgi:hypothetical protein
MRLCLLFWKTKNLGGPRCGCWGAVRIALPCRTNFFTNKRFFKFIKTSVFRITVIARSAFFRNNYPVGR